MTQKEQEFYDALRDVFVGAKVEGESGYINLMRIKSRYFREKVSPKLREDIEATLKKYPDFRNELFDKLYDFFHRYFSESGSIYFRRTRYPQSVYEQVYTDDKDVMLFWKTRMLYYVKTDRLFKSLKVELDGHIFFFDVSTLQHKQANEKRDLVYRFDRVRADGAIVFQVEYSSHGSKTKMLDILRALRGEDVDLGEDLLQRAFRVFEKQSEVDYFINKDAEKFLKEQFDLWMYQYVFVGENVWLQRRIEQLQELKRIAFSVIDFIAQFEDELVRAWNKPKFVRGSHYVITLDRIAGRDADLLARLLAHEGMAAQVAEWRELGMVSQDFEPDDVWARDLFGERLDERFQYLPLDTRHVPDLEMAIVALFDHLDEALDGWLIKSENYQALSTLREKLAGQIKAIYIDPPYNTDTSEFMYQNRFQHSSWLTMMENRLSVTLDLLKPDGILCVTIDDYEFRRLSMLLDNFSEGQVLGVTLIRSKPQGRATARGFSVNHEYGIFFAKSEEAEVGRLPRIGSKAERYGEEDEVGIYTWTNFRGTGANSYRVDRPRLFYPIYVECNKVEIPDMKWDDSEHIWEPQKSPSSGEKVVWPVDSDGQERVWTLGWKRAQQEVHELKVAETVNGTQIYRKYRPNYEGALPGTWWDDTRYSASESGTKILQDILGGNGSFSYPKSVYAVEDSLRSANLDENGFCLDFFAGSGTTAHAVMNLNRADASTGSAQAGGRRKYILVEMADYFDTVLLPRVKKVAFSDAWKDGLAQEGGQGMSHFVKYYKLEQYEDVLRRARYVEDAAPFEDPYQDSYEQYVFLRDLKMLHALEVDHEANEVHVDLSKLYDDIDLAETLANLRGKWIARITPECVEFEDGERIDLQDLDWELIKPLIWW